MLDQSINAPLPCCHSVCFLQFFVPQTNTRILTNCPVHSFSSHLFCSNESLTCYWKSHNNINLCKCLIRLQASYPRWAFTSSIQGEHMAVFLKMACKCFVCRVCSGSYVYMHPWRCTDADLTKVLRRDTGFYIGHLHPHMNDDDLWW